MRKAIGILAFLGILLGGLAFAPSATQAAPAETLALPRCESYSTKWVFWGVLTYVPTTGYENGDMNCILMKDDNYTGVLVLQNWSLRTCHNANVPSSGNYEQITWDTVYFMQVATGTTPYDGIYGPKTRRGAVKFRLYDTGTGKYLGCQAITD